MNATATYAVDFGRHERPRATAHGFGRIPRVARLLAFAHHLDAQIRAGVYDDMAGAARKLGLSRGRLTQIMNLLLLAPGIQEAILAMPPVSAGRDPITERTLRAIVAEPAWKRQLAMRNPLNRRDAAEAPPESSNSAFDGGATSNCFPTPFRTQACKPSQSSIPQGHRSVHQTREMSRSS